MHFSIGQLDLFHSLPDNPAFPASTDSSHAVAPSQVWILRTQTLWLFVAMSKNTWRTLWLSQNSYGSAIEIVDFPTETLKVDLPFLKNAIKMVVSIENGDLNHRFLVC